MTTISFLNANKKFIFQCLKTWKILPYIFYSRSGSAEKVFGYVRLRENDDARMVMDALRGTNMNDDDSAVAGLQMKLVDVSQEDGSRLPYEYDPKALKEFFGKG